MKKKYNFDYDFGRTVKWLKIRYFQTEFDFDFGPTVQDSLNKSIFFFLIYAKFKKAVKFKLDVEPPCRINFQDSRSCSKRENLGKLMVNEKYRTLPIR